MLKALDPATERRRLYLGMLQQKEHSQLEQNVIQFLEEYEDEDFDNFDKLFVDKEKEIKAILNNTPVEGADDALVNKLTRITK